MEFLFWNQMASLEAIIVLLCVALICVIFLYDGYRFVARVLGILTPRKEYVKEKLAEEEKKEEDSLARVEEEVVQISEEEFIPEENLSGDSGEIEQVSEKMTQEEIIYEMEAASSENDEHIEKYFQEESAETIEDIYKEELDSLPLDIQEEILSSETETSEETPSKTIVTETFDVPVEETIEIPNSSLPSDEEPIEESPETVPYVRPTHVHEEIEEVPKKETPQISPEKRDKLIEITNNTKTLIARGHIPEARALIIEWLSLSKNHRELNIMLGELYERDHGFEKAEFIYKDLAHTYPDDAEILMHLAGTLAMQRKYRISYELYKKILSLQGESEEVLYTIAHLASELGETEETYEYARSYIKQYPKNPEVLWLLSQSQVALGKRKDAIETLIKLKNLTPYNQEIVDLIGKLVTEEEMAGNFGEETHQ